MAVINNPKTIAYYEGVDGWPSHYSFIPEAMISLNNRFFSIRDGIIWEHNAPTSITPLNVFYGDAFSLDPTAPTASKPSVIQLVFNDIPQVVKNWKTLGYVGEGSWEASISTNTESRVINENTFPVQLSPVGSITDFVDQEGNFFGNIEGVQETLANIDLKASNISGIGPGNYTNSNSIVQSVLTQLSNANSVLNGLIPMDTTSRLPEVGQIRILPIGNDSVSTVPALQGDIFPRIGGVVQGLTGSITGFQISTFDATRTIADTLLDTATQRPLNVLLHSPDTGGFGLYSVSTVDNSGLLFDRDRLIINSNDTSVVFGTIGATINMYVSTSSINVSSAVNTIVSIDLTEKPDSLLNTGDSIYFFRNSGTQAEPSYDSTLLSAGTVASISGNDIIIDTTESGISTPASDDFFLYGKDKVSETSGVLGNVAIVTMTNVDNTGKAELFQVNTRAFIS